MDDGLLQETLERVRALRGPGIDGLTVERAVVGAVFSGVRLSDGRGGLAGTPRVNPETETPPGAVAGARALSLLAPWPQEPYRRALAVAALNALSAPLLGEERYRVVWDRDALDLLELRAGMSVALVGAFSSYIERLRAVPGLRLKVLELREEALRPEHKAFFEPAARAPEVVPACDALVITGLAAVNGTLEGLLALAGPKAQTILVGPSGSMLPDALFSRGVRWAGGCLLTDADRALDLLSLGAKARHLYGTCARRVNLAPLP